MATVKQLIEHLSAMPPETKVVISMWSEVIDLELDKVVYEEKRYVMRPVADPRYYVTYRDSQWDKIDGEPVFVPVCHFPGN